MEGSSAAEIARQRAEARRQKILARQKDRLTAITGVYSQHDDPGSSGGAEAAAASPAAAAPQPASVAEAAAAPSTGGPFAAASAAAAAPQPSRGHEQQQLEAMLASLQASLQQAAAAAAAAGPPSPPQHRAWGGGGGGGAGASQLDADAANAAMQTLLAGMGSGPFSDIHHASPDPADGGVAAGNGGFGSAPAPRGASPPGPGRRGDRLLDALQRDAPTVVLWFGRVLGVLVQQTQAVRLLSAALVAYAAAAGALRPSGGGGAAAALALRPALALFATQLAILAAAVALLGRGAARTVAERDGQYGGGDGVALPARLRQIDLLSYMPGAREALAGLSGYRQLLNAFSEDFAVYLLVCGLLSLATQP
ncbi:hypothetical protein Rsub_04384 [Raphidocelis subcapitata]|uniref:Uncharacterized protein n=1 Tax=Raphidocelis subcapitata TaxID=307507 RepID=A0A2V0P4B4_9CHLO|nr:hypothetical protein Rsub_04384 [Raphidocelis subcapitata]|eukprot:GBF92037.1 hypothetical protein Rsub_04384 [Raphidocelis subcapitata]